MDGYPRHSETSKPTKGSPMKMLIDLFSTDYGLMSLAVILIVLLMAAFFVRLFVRKMNNNE
jgi:heme/copper-type cytochrome/quinol oxidase subunit 2